jgi:hypothetical protein
MEDDRKYLTEEELARFLKVITDPSDRAIFTIMYCRVLAWKRSAWRDSSTTPAGGD